MAQSNDRLDRIEALVAKNSETIDRIGLKVDRITADVNELTVDANQLTEDGKRRDQRLAEEIKRWDDRFFQLSRDHLMIARTISLRRARSSACPRCCKP
jgi:FtsZ-binding cell division protein ZapB